MAVGALLGILQEDPATWLGYGQAVDGVDAAQIEDLLQKRSDAKKAKDFGAADAIRKQLDDMGIAIEDTPSGPKWKKK
jgi:cysteinyl-tRNA synthetase